jgi:hypothetical protein
MTTELTAVDREALQRAFELACRDPEEAACFEEKLRKEGWQEAAETAAYAIQCRTLKLKCWMAPPCHVHDDVVTTSPCYGHRAEEVALRRRMLAAKLSLYEPNPVEALERAEKARQDERV